MIVSEQGDIILRGPDDIWRCHGSRYDIMAYLIQSLAPMEVDARVRG